MAEVDVEQAWVDLLADLGAALDDLSTGQRFSLVSRRQPIFMTAMRVDERRLRVEAVSNGHLLPADRLEMEALDLLEYLGWNSPTHFVDQDEVPDGGSTNHFTDFVDGWLGSAIASIIVRTLRGVYEVRDPDDLVRHTDPGTSDFSAGLSGLLVRTERPGRPDDEVLCEIIEGLASITSVVSVLPVERTDGVLRVVAADGSVTVYYDAANRLVRAAVPVVTGFPATAEALMALQDCGRPMRCGRLDLRDGTVYALVDLPALPSVGGLLGTYLDSVDANMGVLRDALGSFCGIGTPPLSGS